MYIATVPNRNSPPAISNTHQKTRLKSSTPAPIISLEALLGLVKWSQQPPQGPIPEGKKGGPLTYGNAKEFSTPKPLSPKLASPPEPLMGTASPSGTRAPALSTQSDPDTAIARGSTRKGEQA